MQGTSISDIRARWILDSRGNPTVEADVILASGALGRASVPSGASTGTHEAVELRDGTNEFNGMGVGSAVKNIEDKILPALKGIDAADQNKVDQLMIETDGTDNKSNLGANAILAVSLATAKATATHNNKPFYQYVAQISGNRPVLPLPLVNVINGGAHAKNSTDIQEFMIIPVGAKSFTQAIRQTSEVYQSLKSLVNQHGWSTTVGDEGGFVPQLPSNEAALDLLIDAIGKAGYKIEYDFKLAIDAAASEFYEGDHYRLRLEGQSLEPKQMISWLCELTQKYPLVSIEDGLDQDAWEDWSLLNKKIGNRVQLVGDDLLTTNPSLIEKAIQKRACNAVLIKLNQIGTLSETIRAVEAARRGNMNVIVSHRSGETEDTTIAHLAVGLGAGQIKTGATARTERTSKYNELLRIEDELGKTAKYQGGKVFS